MQLTPFPTPGEPLQFQQAYQTRPKIHIIRVLFQNQTLYKTCKIGKKGCISDHVNKIWKGHDKPIKQNSNKNLYLQTLHLKKKQKTKNKKNKTKQNKQTLLQGYHHFHWNREEHEFPKLFPPPPHSYNIDVAQKICTSRTISLHNIIIQIFRHPKFSPSLMKKFHTPQFHHPPPFQKQKKENTSLSPYIWCLSIL